jgi:hypothetical protein
MRRVFTGILLIVMALQSALHAQNFGLQAGFGMHASRMDDMKYLQKYFLESYPVEGKIISSFPVYTMGSLRIVKQLSPALKIGAGYALAITGGRSNYTDYTGSINSDMLASSHRLGAYVSYAVFGGEWYDIAIYGQLDANYTLMGITTTLYVLGYQDGVVYKYASITPSGTAGLEFLFHLNDFTIGLNGGYQVDKPGKMEDRDSGKDLKDPHDSERILTSDWTGWMAQLTVLIWF